MRDAIASKKVSAIQQFPLTTFVSGNNGATWKRANMIQSFPSSVSSYVLLMCEMIKMFSLNQRM